VCPDHECDADFAHPVPHAGPFSSRGGPRRMSIPGPKVVAALCTVYRPRSHADVIAAAFASGVVTIRPPETTRLACASTAA
jgi:hypothetical protein